jgi:hypothetical protein
VRRFSRFVSTKERWAQNRCSINVHIYMKCRDKLADIQYIFNATSLVIPASSFELVDARPPNIGVCTPFVCWQGKIHGETLRATCAILTPPIPHGFGGMLAVHFGCEGKEGTPTLIEPSTSKSHLDAVSCGTKHCALDSSTHAFIFSHTPSVRLHGVTRRLITRSR